MAGYTARTIPRPSGDGWQSCPSVTYGGAPSFWTRRTESAREWVAYDRAIRGWMLTREPFAASDPVTREPYSTEG